MDLLAQEDDTEDKRKLVLSALSQEEQGSKSPWSWSSADAKVVHEKALRQLKELKAKPVFSIDSIRAAKLTSD
jgi:hypothetical protein